MYSIYVPILVGFVLVVALVGCPWYCSMVIVLMLSYRSFLFDNFMARTCCSASMVPLSCRGGGRWQGPTCVFVGVFAHVDAMILLDGNNELFYSTDMAGDLLDNVPGRALLQLASLHGVSISRACRRSTTSMRCALRQHQCNTVCPSVGVVFRTLVSLVGGSVHVPPTVSRMTNFCIAAGFPSSDLADRTRVFFKLYARKGLRPFVSNTSLLNDGTRRRGEKRPGFSSVCHRDNAKDVT